MPIKRILIGSDSPVNSETNKKNLRKVQPSRETYLSAAAIFVLGNRKQKYFALKSGIIWIYYRIRKLQEHYSSKWRGDKEGHLFWYYAIDYHEDSGKRGGGFEVRISSIFQRLNRAASHRNCEKLAIFRTKYSIFLIHSSTFLFTKLRCFIP